VLRPDVEGADVTVILWATARIIERTADVAPEQVGPLPGDAPRRAAARRGDRAAARSGHDARAAGRWRCAALPGVVATPRRDVGTQPDRKPDR